MLGTPLKKSATRLLLLGSGELGKEVVIEAQRLGVEVIAVDRYPNAPAMQVAHRSHVISMLDRTELDRVIRQERPTYIVPEIEAIDTSYLLELEREGFTVIPTARAANLTMNREGIRRLAAEELGLPTAAYRFAGSIDEFRAGVTAIGFPCVVKPIMSSSGKGQSVVKTTAEVDAAWSYAMEGARGASDKVIVEAFIVVATTTNHREIVVDAAFYEAVVSRDRRRKSHRIDAEFLRNHIHLRFAGPDRFRDAEAAKRAAAQFANRYFPREEGGTNVRQVWIRVFSQRGISSRGCHRVRLKGACDNPRQ